MSLLAGDGVVGISRDSGLTFSQFKVRRSNVDLRTVRLVAPAVILEGRLAISGTLDGPLRNIDFDGTVRHQDGERPASQAVGTIHLDTRFDTLGLATDVTLDPLSFAGIRPAFPSLTAKGELHGPFRSQGTLSKLRVEDGAHRGAWRCRGARHGRPPPSVLGSRRSADAVLAARPVGAGRPAAADPPRRAASRDGQRGYRPRPRGRPRARSRPRVGCANGSSTACTPGARSTIA